MSTYTSDIYKRIQADTGYSTTVIRNICRSFQSNVLWGLHTDANNRVVLNNFMTLELKDASNYKAKSNTLIAGASKTAKKVSARLAPNLRAKISASGYSQALEDVWGSRPEFVLGVKKYAR